MNSVLVAAINPIEQVETASQIIKSAFHAPCLDYDARLLTWRFSTPSGLDPISFMAYDDGRPSVFVCAMGHRVSVAGVERDIYISSFFSAKPGASPALPVSVLRSLTRALKSAGVPCLLFAQAGTAGEKMLLPLRDYRQIDDCQVYAGVGRVATGGVEVEEVRVDAWQGAYRDLSPENNQAIIPVLESAHYLHAPSDRRLLAVFRGSHIVGCAVHEQTRLSGGQVQSSLHHVRAVDAEAMRGLMAHCGGVTVLPNLHLGFSPALAGIRQTGARYSAFLIGDLDATETWTEII